ncbi:hypothetical protein [uncultured Draconibacterium sp.]|uniref:hypothetical protein n=1 Tax=uncultured Draconibacterium sp. TaxID=1573823 RepID=UPI0029C80AD7|nr:hypothetical protein [uncultured Draconibacterium sp.]
MKKLINLIAGIIAGILPLVVAGIFSVFIYNELQNVFGIIIGVLLALSAIWIGIQIFKKVQQNGIVDFMAVVTASPDLDNLEPTANSNTKKRTAKELAELNHKNENIFKEGTLKIFGDWHGAPYQNSLKILSIDYNEEKKQMEILFSENTKILIDEPDLILESPSVLKVLSAKRIKLEFQHKKKGTTAPASYFKNYTVVNNRVDTATNMDWIKHKIDAAIGQDALIIFN